MKKININLIFIFLYVFLLFLLSILRYEFGYCSAWDLGIFSQVVYSLTKGKFFLYNVEPWWCGRFTCSFFSIHFAPILVLLVPFYYIYPNPLSILFFKFLLFLGSLFVLGRIVRSLIGPEYVYIVLWIYLLHPGIVGSFLFDFHLEDFFPLFFFVFLYGWIKKDYRICLISYVLLCLSLEYFSIYMSLIIVSLLLFENHEKVTGKLLIISFLILLSGFIIYKLETFVINMFRSNVFKNIYLSHDILRNFSLSNLSYCLMGKIIYLLLLFVPFGLIPLLKKPKLLLALVPWFTLVLFTRNLVYINIASQYSAFVVPVITMAFLFSLKDIKPNKDMLKYLVASSFMCSLYLVFIGSLFLLSLSRPFTGANVIKIINHYKKGKTVLPDDVFVFYSNSLETYTIMPEILYKNKKMRQIIETWTIRILKDLNASTIVVNYRRLSPTMRFVVFDHISGYRLCYYRDGLMIFKRSRCTLNFTSENISIDLARVYGLVLVNGNFVFYKRNTPYCELGFEKDLLPGDYVLYINNRSQNNVIVYPNGSIDDMVKYNKIIKIKKYGYYVVCVNDLKNNTTIRSIVLRYVRPMFKN